MMISKITEQKIDAVGSFVVGAATYVSTWGHVKHYLISAGAAIVAGFLGYIGKEIAARLIKKFFKKTEAN